jgi:hypothetical protein
VVGMAFDDCVRAPVAPGFHRPKHRLLGHELSLSGGAEAI